MNCSEDYSKDKTRGLVCWNLEGEEGYRIAENRSAEHRRAKGKYLEPWNAKSEQHKESNPSKGSNQGQKWSDKLQIDSELATGLCWETSKISNLGSQDEWRIGNKHISHILWEEQNTSFEEH